MGQYAYDRLTRIQWVVTLSSTTSPTAAQLNAGTNLSTFVTADGVNFAQTNNKVPTATIASTTDTEVTGSVGATLALTGLRDDAADTFWTLCNRGTDGFVVLRYAVLYSTAFAAAQPVIVIPCEMFDPTMNTPARNTSASFVAEFAVTNDVQNKAVVA